MGLGLLILKISLLNFYPYVCGISLFHICSPPTTLDGCGFFNSILVRLLSDFNLIYDHSEWWLFYILVVILMWLCKEVSHVCLRCHLTVLFFFIRNHFSLLLHISSNLYCVLDIINDNFYSFLIRLSFSKYYLVLFWDAVIFLADLDHVEPWFSLGCGRPTSLSSLIIGHSPYFLDVVFLLQPGLSGVPTRNPECSQKCLHIKNSQYFSISG